MAKSHDILILLDFDIDGTYLLNLQVPPFSSDAAPSWPIFFRLDL